jgi:hypothetical protein
MRLFFTFCFYICFVRDIYMFQSFKLLSLAVFNDGHQLYIYICIKPNYVLRNRLITSENQSNYYIDNFQIYLVIALAIIE